MLDKIVRLAIIGIVLYIVYYIAGLIVYALNAPAIILTLVLVVLLLVFAGALLREFGVSI